MSFTVDIAKRIYPYMKSRGFRRKGRRFYYVQNSIAFSIDLEMPTDWVYVWAYVLPLYIPCEFIPLSYGDRMGDIPSIRLPILQKTDSEDQIIAWCKLLCSRIEDTILPIYRTIDSPQKLAAYIERGGAYREFMHCSELHMDELRIYTHLYLRTQDKLRDAMEHYEQEIPLFPSTPEMRMKQEKWLQKMRILSESDEEVVRAYFDQAKGITGKYFK